MLRVLFDSSVIVTCLGSIMKSLVVVVVVAYHENLLTKKRVVGRSPSAKNRPCSKGLENRGMINKRLIPLVHHLLRVGFGAAE